MAEKLGVKKKIFRIWRYSHVESTLTITINLKIKIAAFNIDRN